MKTAASCYVFFAVFVILYLIVGSVALLYVGVIPGAIFCAVMYYLCVRDAVEILVPLYSSKLTS